MASRAPSSAPFGRPPGRARAAAMVRSRMYWLLVAVTVLLLLVLVGFGWQATAELFVLPAFVIWLAWGSPSAWWLLVLGNAVALALTVAGVATGSPVAVGGPTSAIQVALIAGSVAQLLILLSRQMRTAVGIEGLDWKRWSTWREPVRITGRVVLVVMEAIVVLVAWVWSDLHACGFEVCPPGDPGVLRNVLGLGAFCSAPAITIVGFWLRRGWIVAVGFVLAVAASAVLVLLL